MDRQLRGLYRRDDSKEQESLGEKDYKEIAPIRTSPEFRSPLDAFLASTQRSRRIDIDEFSSFVDSQPTNYIDWSHNMQCDYPGLCQSLYTCDVSRSGKDLLLSEESPHSRSQLSIE